MSERIFGIHPVLEALRAQPRSVTRIAVLAGRHDARIEALLNEARAAGITVQRQPRQALDRLAAGESHQGVVAWMSQAEYSDPDDIVDRAASPPLLVVLDGVDDPRNLGAVIRSAAAAGADGLFIPTHGSPGLTAVAIKASAGTASRLSVGRVTNIVYFLKSLKEKGIWVVGVDPEGPVPWTGFDMRVPLALVLGGEGRGLRRLARETCDALVSIPLRQGVESLNLSVAAGIVLFEAVRQRHPAGQAPARGQG